MIRLPASPEHSGGTPERIFSSFGARKYPIDYTEPRTPELYPPILMEALI